MEAHHRSVAPDAGRNSGGRQIKKTKKALNLYLQVEQILWNKNLVEEITDRLTCKKIKIETKLKLIVKYIINLVSP